MATGTNGIATEGEAQNKGNWYPDQPYPDSSVKNKCCTKSMAILYGCAVSGNYEDNQLVKYSDLSPKPNTYFRCKITFEAGAGTYDIFDDYGYGSAKEIARGRANATVRLTYFEYVCLNGDIIEKSSGSLIGKNELSYVTGTASISTIDGYTYLTGYGSSKYQVNHYGSYDSNFDCNFTFTVEVI